MATVRISFKSGDVPIVTGDMLPIAKTAIVEPTDIGFRNNRPFIVTEDGYCLGLDISIDFDEPLNTTAARRQAQKKVKAIITSRVLQPGDVALPARVGGETLRRHPCFRAPVPDIGLPGAPEADPVPTCVVPRYPRRRAALQGSGPCDVADERWHLQ